MKVLHIALTDGGGAGLGMINQHQALLCQGIDSKVLVAFKQTHLDTVVEMQPNQSIWSSNRHVYWLEKVFRRLGLCFTRYDKIHHQIYKIRKKYPAQFSSPITPYDLSRHPLVQEADVINLHYVAGFVDIASFFAKVKKPIVWTLRDENPGLGGFHYRASRQQYYAPYAKLEDQFLDIKRKAIGSCQDLHLVSLSGIMKQFCHGVDFLKNHPNTIIYNAINADDYQLLDRGESRRSLGLQAGDIVLSFVCYHLGEKRKGFEQVVRALDLLDNKHIKLLCVGACNFEITHPQVISLGVIKDKQKLSQVYSASDAFVTPSAQESFGKTVVEALYCGTPVVSTPVGIAPEIIQASNGVLCGKGTAQEVATAIQQVLSTQYDRKGIREKAISQFAPEQVAEQYIELYRKVALETIAGLVPEEELVALKRARIKRLNERVQTEIDKLWDSGKWNN